MAHTFARGYPICLTFDFDAESNWISRDPSVLNKPVAMSNGAYGARTGLPRVLELLRRHNVRATFFVPGWVVDRWTDQVESIVADGHELAHHGWLHEWPDTLSGPDEELELLEKGCQIIEKVSGRRPRGYRSPGEFSAETIRLLELSGFEYASNMLDSDSPYMHASNGGRPLVELPMQFQLDDAPFSAFSLRLPGRQLYPPREMLEIWMGEYNALRSLPGTYYMLACHPQYVGRAGRMAVLDKLLEHMRSDAGVWFATCEEVAVETRSFYEVSDGGE
jgi:peptidoglycan/xylan/chitin deacetylase (PgdA/CDA1 family)